MAEADLLSHPMHHHLERRENQKRMTSPQPQKKQLRGKPIAFPRANSIV